ncbi:Uncharacterized protein TCM_038852 [Theobroma cacao]|uniref:Reverse transcriptase domain-containing protein n=1 Tax=Theobroma cacao TaxID=3641 RepID=A0A061GQG2_THECC|nr:Uncharacterized protein TCM_038852 [Theobroma cacao]
MGENDGVADDDSISVQKKRIKSHIFKIQQSDGEWVEDPAAIKASTVEFFSSLMKKEQCDLTRFNSSIISTLVSATDNNFLCAALTIQEVKEAVFAIDKDSIAEPDGFSSFFYQHCWDILANDLIAAVLDFFQGTYLPRGITSTTLVLLSKKSNASAWSIFGLLVYDFLVTVLQQFGFCRQWVDMIQRCISNCWFSVLINGMTAGYFKSEWGLRQGDFISVQLFILAAEYLSRGLNALFAQYPSLYYDVGYSFSALWQHSTFPSSKGGLDIRSLNDVFEAFSMKLWWRFQTCTSLWTRFMRAKYCTGRIPRQIQLKLHDSQTWKRMLASCPVTKQHIKWQIGRGELVFWHDCWMDCTSMGFTLSEGIPNSTKNIVLAQTISRSSFQSGAYTSELVGCVGTERDLIPYCLHNIIQMYCFFPSVSHYDCVIPHVYHNNALKYVPWCNLCCKRFEFLLYE